MRIAILCFGIGTIANVSGMEKVFVDMANAFAEHGHEVWSVWNDGPGIAPFYKFNESVHQVNLGLGKIKVPFLYKAKREINKGLHRNVRNEVDIYKTNILVHHLKNRIDVNRLDCIVCHEFNSVMVANSLSGGKIPVVAMVHNSVEDQLARLTELQRQEASKADAYVVLMPSYIKEAEKLLTTRIVHIPNIVPQIKDSDLVNIDIEKTDYTIINIGRIEGRQKRQMILIKAFAQLADKYPNWKIKLFGPVGDSLYKEEITKFIIKNHLENKIKYCGITENSIEELKRADIFAFPSAYEGFSLALTEAMGAGLPAIGFKYAPSVGELILHEKTGLLAVDDDSFTYQLERLMGDSLLRKRLGMEAHNAMKQYAPEAVWQKWEDLLFDFCDKYKR